MTITPKILPATRLRTLSSIRLQPEIWFAIGLFIIILFAGAMRLSHTNWGLPYVEYGDEAHLYWMGQARRGLYNSNYGRTYPPLFLIVNAGTQQVLEGLGQPGLAPTVYALRNAAAIMNTACIAVIGISAYLLAGSIAGWIAAIAWSVSDFAVSNALVAIPEPFVYPLLALSLLLVGIALTKQERKNLGIWGLMVLAIASVLEFRLVFLLFPGVLIVFRDYAKRRHWTYRQWGILTLLTIIIAIVTVIFFYFTLSRSYRAWLVRILTSDSWNVSLLLGYIEQSLRGIGEPLLAGGIIVLGGVGVFIARRRNIPHPDVKRLLFYGGAFLLLCWLMVAIRWSDDGVLPKNALMATVALCVLLGAAVGQWTRLLGKKLFQVIFISGVVVLLFIPELSKTLSVLDGMTGVSWQVIIRQWADQNLTPGTVIVYPGHENTFNPYWGGIPYRNWFDWWPTKDIMEHSVEEWRVLGMSYALIPIPQYNAMKASEEGQIFLNQMLHLRDFVHPPVRREPEGIFYRLWRPEVETAFQFSDSIQLTGYDASSKTVRQGDVLTLHFYWQTDLTPSDNYSLFIHLVPMDENTVLAQADGAPAAPDRPTLEWDDPTETLISPAFSLPIPDDLASGEYRVMIGLYNYLDGVRLTVQDSAGNSLGDALELLDVTVNE